MKKNRGTNEKEYRQEGSPFLLDLRRLAESESKDSFSAPLKITGPDFLKRKKKSASVKLFAAISRIFQRRSRWQRLHKQARKALAREQAKISSLANRWPSLALKGRRQSRHQDQDYSRLYQILVFTSIMAVVILPLKLIAQSDQSLGRLKESIIGRTQEGIGNMGEAYHAIAALDLSGARNDFSRASQSFVEAKKQISDFHQVLLDLASLSGNEDIKVASQGRDFLEIAALSASLGETVSLMASSLFDTQGSLSDKLAASSRYAESASLGLEHIQVLMDGIEEDALPEKYRDKFLEIKKQAGIIGSGLSSFAAEAEKIGGLLGADMDRRYLVVFQNNSEMRGGGGFAGSFALVDVSEGKIKNIEVPVGGSYDTEAGMLDFFKAPRPLRLLNARWFFWDANWWPDWPSSARHLEYMYEKSAGPSVDGVITITPSMIERLLGALGPIVLSDGTVITEGNFWQYLQTTVEQENIREKHPDLVVGVPAIQENQPKKIIGEIAVQMIEEFPGRINQNNLAAFIKSIESSLASKDFLLYFSDPNLQEKAEAYNWAGKMRQAPQDYLLVAHTNIGGQKTDRVIEEEITHQAKIDADGSIVDSVTVERAHRGVKGDAFTGVRNVDWLRIYVPEGSEVVSASGFSVLPEGLFEEPEASWLELPSIAAEEAAATLPSGIKVYNENGFSVIAGWVMTDPGEQSQVNVTYRLPFKVSARRTSMTIKEEVLQSLGFASDNFFSYSLLWQKQPGIKAPCVKHVDVVEAPFLARWQYPEVAGSCQALDGDRAFAIIFN